MIKYIIRKATSSGTEWFLAEFYQNFVSKIVIISIIITLSMWWYFITGIYSGFSYLSWTSKKDNVITVQPVYENWDDIINAWNEAKKK